MIITLNKSLWHAAPKRINRANPITRDLLLCFDAATGVELVTNTPFQLPRQTYGGKYGNAPIVWLGQLGRAIYDSPIKQNYPEVSWDILYYRGQTEKSAYCQITYSGDVRQNIFGFDGYYVKATVSGADYSSRTWTCPAGTSQLHRQEYVQCLADVSADSFTFYLNGSAVSSPTASGTAQPYLVSIPGGVNTKFSVNPTNIGQAGPSFFRCWGRKLTEDERLSLLADPWQIFEADPLEIWIPSGISGETPTTIQATAATVTLSGQTATVVQTAKVQANAAVVALSGQTATITDATATQVQAAAAVVALSGQTATVVQTAKVQATAATVTLSGQAATVVQTAKVQANAAVVALSGQTATVVQTAKVQATAATITLSGQAATVVEAGKTAISAAAAVVALSGQTATVVQTAKVQANVVTITLSGQAATVVQTAKVQANAAVVALSGQTATIAGTAYTVINCSAASVAVLGQTGVVSQGQSISSRTVRRYRKRITPDYNQGTETVLPLTTSVGDLASRLVPPYAESEKPARRGTKPAPTKIEAKILKVDFRAEALARQVTRLEAQISRMEKALGRVESILDDVDEEEMLIAELLKRVA